MDEVLKEFEYLYWLELDENGYSYIRDDAPEEVKKKYYDDIKYEEENSCKF